MNYRLLCRRMAVVVLLAVVGLLVLYLTALFPRGESRLNATPSLSAEEQQALLQVQESSRAFATVVKMVRPAVVNIHVVRVRMVTRSPLPPGFDDDFFRHFFGGPLPQRQQRQYEQRQPITGSGVIVDAARGHILTNNHVVEGADSITVKLADGREMDAKIVGTDPPTDLAVIRIDADELPEARLGDSDAIEVGEWVIAIGNPFGRLNLTVTSGVVSAKGRSGFSTAGYTPTYQDYIQTDAAINPGNSGGPLVNLKGEVIGINSVILSPTGTFAGYGFAIPSNMAREVMKQLAEKGSVTRGYLGFFVQDLTPELAEGFGLPKDTKGVAVPQVEPGSAAEKAGLEPNDVVVKINGKPVTSVKQLRNLVAGIAPGTKVTLTVLRNGKKLQLTATLTERPSGPTAARGRAPAIEQRLGLKVTALTTQLAEQLGLGGEQGVVVSGVAPGSPADEAGLRPGDLIKQVNRTPVPDVATYRRVLGGLGSKDTVLLLVKTRGASRFVTIRPK